MPANGERLAEYTPLRGGARLPAGCIGVRRGRPGDTGSRSGKLAGNSRRILAAWHIAGTHASQRSGLYARHSLKHDHQCEKQPQRIVDASEGLALEDLKQFRRVAWRDITATRRRYSKISGRRIEPRTGEVIEISTGGHARGDPIQVDAFIMSAAGLAPADWLKTSFTRPAGALTSPDASS